MKKRIIFLFFAGLFHSVTAQIPNASFENWDTVSQVVNPSFWQSLNLPNTTLANKMAIYGSPGTAGSKYLKLTSQKFNNKLYTGMITSGKMDSVTLEPLSGFPFTNRPGAIVGKWQHMVMGGNQGFVLVLLTKWNSNTLKRDTIAYTKTKLVDMAMAWEDFEIPLDYVSSDLPDSCIIQLSASGNLPKQSDYLWVDELAFSGTAGTLTLAKDDLIQVYPNPFHSSIQVKIDSQLKIKNIELINSVGKQVASTEVIIGNQWIIDENIPSGNYFIRIESDNNQVNYYQLNKL